MFPILQYHMDRTTANYIKLVCRATNQPPTVFIQSIPVYSTKLNIYAMNSVFNKKFLTIVSAMNMCLCMHLWPRTLVCMHTK